MQAHECSCFCIQSQDRNSTYNPERRKMLKINSTSGDELFRWLLLIGVLGVITERTIHFAMAKAFGEFRPTGRITRFIRADSTLLVVTLLSSWVPMLYVIFVRSFSAANIVDILTQARSSNGVFGWAMTILITIQALAPIVVGICLLIGRRRRRLSSPADMLLSQ